jgi:shikimate dehydrogenase
MVKKKPTAGRYTLADLEKWHEIARDIDPPVRLGIFGDPVEHSLSPQMQNAALKHCRLGMQYGRFHILPDELPQALNLIRGLDFVGVNLTVPHKIRALSLIDAIDPDAGRTGAVNTVSIDHGTLRGFNTDGRGFSRAIRKEFSVDLRDLRVLVLGAGGAARAIAMQCAKENCERLVIAHRSLEKATRLAHELRDFFVGPKVFGPVPRLQAVVWEEAAIRFQIAHIDLVVNATPLGLNRSDPSPVPARLLAPHSMVYDTLYSTDRTSLVAAAIEAGARGANGLSMLLYQGALAFEIWFRREAPLEVMSKGIDRGD